MMPPIPHAGCRGYCVGDSPAFQLFCAVLCELCPHNRRTFSKARRRATRDLIKTERRKGKPCILKEELS